MKKGNVLNRDTLYEEVWSKPIVRLAAEYEISDSGLKKICKTLNVPTPPRGKSLLRVPPAAAC